MRIITTYLNQKTILMKCLILTFMLALLHLDSNAQNCLEVTTGSYSGNITEGAFDKYGNDGNITISAIGSDKISISDFTAESLAQFQKNEPSVVLDLNCDGTIVSKSFSTDFGEATITSGSYDAENQQFALNWKIPHNRIEEKAVFTKN